MKKLNKKGFSLVELIVVVAIMAVLVGVLAPSLLRYVEKTRVQKDASAVSEVVEAARLSMADETVNKKTATGSKITIASDGSITCDTTDNALSAEVKKAVPSVSFSSASRAAVTITVTKDANGAVTFGVTTTSTGVDWKTAVEAVK
ncbi:MAG: type II secretion system protein [Oscillospiraceae bacterium]|nr:type II secretion system protein [Oscillospiraceae bacterium]